MGAGVFLAAAMLVLGLAQRRSLSRRFVESEAESLLTEAQASAHVLVSAMHDISAELRFVAEVPGLAELQQDVAADALAQLRQRLPLIDSVALLDGHGRVLLADPPEQDGLAIPPLSLGGLGVRAYIGVSPTSDSRALAVAAGVGGSPLDVVAWLDLAALPAAGAFGGRAAGLDAAIVDANGVVAFGPLKLTGVNLGELAGSPSARAAMDRLVAGGDGAGHFPLDRRGELETTLLGFAPGGEADAWSVAVLAGPDETARLEKVIGGSSAPLALRLGLVSVIFAGLLWVERQLSREAGDLVASEGRYRRVFQEGTECALVVGGARVTEASDRAVEELGWSLRELARMPLDKLVTLLGDEPELFSNALRQCAAWQTLPVRLLRRDGTTVVAEAHVRPLAELGGPPYYLALKRLGGVDDTVGPSLAQPFADTVYDQDAVVDSAWADSEAALSRRGRAAVKRPGGQSSAYAHKMEVVETLARGLGHDFNNVLSVILGYSSLIKRLPHLRHDVASYVDVIHTSAQRAAGLVKQLLALSPGDCGPLEALDTMSLLDRVRRVMRPSLREGYSIDVLAADGLPPVMARGSELEQAIVNLCLNARDAMPSGGEMTLRASVVEADGSQRLSCPAPPPGSYVQIEVSDSGVGMDQETQRRMFDPYFTTKGPGKGTGLGLTMVYGAVRRCGGVLSVMSEEGRGTTVSVLLPAAVTSDSPHRRATHDGQLGGTETLLVVDDEAHILRLVQSGLGSLGYDVIVASDGEEALEAYRKHGDRVSLILLDMIMPQMGGSETWHAVRASDARAKVLFMSGYSGEAPPPTGPGVVGYIHKPFTINLLAETVREALDADAHRSDREGLPSVERSKSARQF